MPVEPSTGTSAAGTRRRGTVGLAYRAAVGAAGASIILVGLVLVPLPGPGWPIVFLGFVVLGTEFEWAGRIRRRVQVHVIRATRWSAAASWPIRGALKVALVASVVVPVLLMTGHL